MFLERQTELAEKCIGLFIRGCCRYECNLHSEDLGDLVDVNLREDDLLLDTEGVVALPVKFLGNTVEIPDTREGDTDDR